MGGAPAESTPSSSEGQVAGSGSAWEWFEQRKDAINAFTRELASTRGITLDSASAALSPVPSNQAIGEFALKLAYERGASAARAATSVAAPLPLPVRPVSSEGAPTPPEEVAAEVMQLRRRIAALRDAQTQTLKHTGPPPSCHLTKIFNELFHPNTSENFQKSCWQSVQFPVELGILHLPAMVGTAAQTSAGTKEIVQVESRKQFVRPLSRALAYIANGTLHLPSEGQIGNWMSEG